MREYFALPGRIHKWIELYDQVPGPDSWAWKYYPDGQFWNEKVQKYGNSVLEKVIPMDPEKAVDLVHL